MMDYSNKQAEIQIFDTNYNRIGLMYRPMNHDDLLIDRMQRASDYNKGFNGLLDKIFNSVSSMNRLELPEHTNENSAPLSNRELRHYALGVVRCLDDHIKFRTARKSIPEDAMSQLVKAAKRIGADAIVVDADKPFQNEDGYALVGLFYVKK